MKAAIFILNLRLEIIYKNISNKQSNLFNRVTDFRHFKNNKPVSSLEEIKSDVIIYGNTVLSSICINDITLPVIGKLKLVSGIVFDESNTNDVQRSLVYAHENERRKIAEELHDSVGPVLSATKMAISCITESIKKENIEQLEGLTYISELLDLSLSEIRTISLNISPSVLTTKGLFSAINTYTNRVSKTTKVQFHITISDNIQQISDTYFQITIYRIFQELITNTIKYSDAENIFIRIQESILDGSKFIIASYSEDGSNFHSRTIDHTNNHMGIGLANIQSRLSSLSGEIINLATNTVEHQYPTFIFRIPRSFVHEK